jgi:hypothetical protein
MQNETLLHVDEQRWGVDEGVSRIVNEDRKIPLVLFLAQVANNERLARFW